MSKNGIFTRGAIISFSRPFWSSGRGGTQSPGITSPALPCLPDK